ncbi:50S ribosomal protein L24 [Candidatus Nomurabacteria bacterium RIFCSPHIGHO2_02_FULL_33_12]|uniref:Large ribosomal subunit protein uL24 n=1 Tax=Candidatus Nomurabacteria bacterium RIFCSPLOWO2_01_FULL_33_17 TaxID=1801764 RepID=A0A1F6WQ91_9BACT|nr:MAG: 50S ribosomal protein L24 [Candidatus Nomurabacteria bacterium RIFCSPHIGHO2_02_FULL_33_12]OGI84027.1 MAG: 50S ribosomal protein L24 [Candidatus Nomurabacteria bacterium RIFCSPLOWO2_01_FULL_33_17]
MHVKKGDIVIVRTGKDKGIKGKILSSSPKTNKVIVEGARLHKKHLKPKTRGGVGEVIQKPGWMDASNVQLIDPKTGTGTRVGKKTIGDKKVRISKKSGQEV